MGKKKSQKRVRKPRVVIEVTERRKVKYEKAADLADLSISEWCRRILDVAADKALVLAAGDSQEQQRRLEDFVASERKLAEREKPIRAIVLADDDEEQDQHVTQGR